MTSSPEQDDAYIAALKAMIVENAPAGEGGEGGGGDGETGPAGPAGPPGPMRARRTGRTRRTSWTSWASWKRRRRREHGGWPSAADFPGNDLGAKLNAAFAAGHLAVDVPPAQWTISTPVNLPMGACVRIDWHSYPHHIICATRGKPVFECVGGKRHWRILGGCFYGSGSGTPCCFLLCGRDDATGQQCGDIGLLSAVQTSGSWGIAGVVNIAGEILNFQDCNFWMQGRGDMDWNGATATVIIANADYFGLPYTYTKANTKTGSCSAIVFQNCDIRGDQNADVPAQRAGRGCHHHRVLPDQPEQLGSDRHRAFTQRRRCPRRLYLGGGGRTENNTGGANPGCPVILVDGQGIGAAGLYECTIGAMGFFVGGAMSHSTPVLKAMNGGVIYGLTWDQGGHIEHTNMLIDHRTADLQWASIRSRFNAHIECSGRSIHHSTIRIGGEVRGNIGTKTKVLSSNQNNW